MLQASKGHQRMGERSSVTAAVSAYVALCGLLKQQRQCLQADLKLSQ
jgi:hypothetical protein